MKKYLSIFVLSLLAVANVHAGVELRTSFVDDTKSIYVVELVDTQSGEVIDTKSFRYNDARIAELTADAGVVVQEQTEDVVQDHTVLATDGFSVSDITDQPIVTDAAIDSDSNTDVAPQKVSKWDVIKQALQGTKTRLSSALDNIKGVDSEVTATVPVTETVELETVEIAPPVVVPAEEAGDTVLELPQNNEVTSVK